MFEALVKVLLFSLLCNVVYRLGLAVYNITLHPLAKIPGPKLRGAFYFPTYWGLWAGNDVKNVKALHDRYGDTVRTSPSTVSFSNGVAWQEIYAQRQGKKPLPKDEEAYFVANDRIPALITANDSDHSRIRRSISHAFSEAALREQEPLMDVYFDLLIRKLHEKIDGQEHGKVNMVRWFNFTTFDLVGDLCFGESFDALRTEEYGSWIAHIFPNLQFLRVLRILRAYPLIGTPLLFILTRFTNIQKGRKKHLEYARDKTSRRLDAETDRRDFMSYILRHNDEKGVSKEEIMKLTQLLIIAGSETTATLLSGALFYLLKNTSALSKLTTELRTTFQDSRDLTFVRLANAPYLNACLQEALRVYPPVVAALPRKTQKGGAVINGHFIPEGCSVGVFHYGTYRSPSNFADPDEYIPERWLDDPRFESDKRGALQPFSLGPRNCVGQHLAMAEMRAILARVVWHFDISLCEESKEWSKQKVFLLWEKPDLMVKLQVRK